MVDRLLNGIKDILDPAHTAVIVVDMQNDFCAEGGYIDNTQNADMSPNRDLARRLDGLLGDARRAGVAVVWIKAIYDHDKLPVPMLSKMLEKGKGAVCCASDSWGAEFYGVAPLDDEPVIEKHCYSAFHETGLHDLLQARGIRTLVMTGVATNVCVESTLRAGFFHGYYIVMPPDCVGSANAALHEATITSVDLIFGHVPDSVEVAGVWADHGHSAVAAQ